MYLNKSHGRKNFKASLGNANHLIITSLVGLKAIEDGLIDGIPSEMRMAWSPKSPEISARRARRLVLDMALIRSVDAIDVYLRDAMRLPALIQDDQIRRQIDQAGRSIFKKLVALEATIQGLNPLLCAMIAVLVSWRNGSAHIEADDILSVQHREVITNNSTKIASRFSGLDTGVLLNNYDLENPPAFKEIASLINASHHFIQDLEHHLFARLDQSIYLKQMVGSVVKSKAVAGGNSTSKVKDIWGRDPGDRPRYVHSLLRHSGLAETRAQNGPSVHFAPEIIERVLNFNPQELAIWLNN